MAPLNIAIIGAGPAGCMLGRLLQHANNRNVRVTIFESESRLDFRSQGGTLDLHQTTGQSALQAGGLFEGFLEYARYDGEAMKICDKNLLCYVSMGGSNKPKSGTKSHSRPEIDRPQLRRLLYEGLVENTVQWNRRLERVDQDLSLHFKDGSVETGFDLIVGADGAWSRVRPRVSDVVPYFSGLGGHWFSISDAERSQPELFKLVNRGSLFAFSDGRAIFAQYMSDGSIDVGSEQHRPADWQASVEFDVHDVAAVKADAHIRYADWDPRLVDFILKADGEAKPRDLYMLPVGHKWDHVPGVTLIGDASHLMTPFAGEGVNLALADSLKLSQFILAGTNDVDHPRKALDTQIELFEKDMFVRCTATQQLTLDMMNAMFFTPGAPRTTIEKYLLRAMSDELGRLATMLLTPLVYLWFAVFKLIW